MAFPKNNRKANKKATRGIRKGWHKGQSSCFNPTFNKHRLEAKKRAVFGVKGGGNLTESQLAQHNKLTAESQCNDIDERSVGGETAMTAFTNCSLPTFSRLLTNWNAQSALHKEMLAVIAAVTDVIKTNGGEETETEYFAALMTTLDVVDTDEGLTAVVTLLSMIVRRLNESVLKLHGKRVCKKIVQLLLDPKYLNSDHCALLRNLLLILHTFLKVKIQWIIPSEQVEKENKEISYEMVLKCLLEYTTHHKPKVRRVAQEIICKLLKSCDSESSSSHLEANLAADFCIEVLLKYGGSNLSKEVFYVLSLLQEIISLLPKMKIKVTCETIFKVMTLSNGVLLSSCLKTLQGLFDKQSSVKNLPADINAKIINVLYNYEPNVHEGQLLIHWLQLMEAAFFSLLLLDERLCLLHLPAFTSRAVKCWLSDRDEILSCVEFILKNLVSKCINPNSPTFQQLLLDDPLDNAVHKMFYAVKGALSYEYCRAWKHVLNVLAVFFQVIGKCSYTVMLKCLQSLGDMHNSHQFPYLDELERAIGIAVQHMGPRIVLEAIPLQLNLESSRPEFPRSWLLPLLRDNIKKAELSFFVKYFQPLALKLRNKVIALEQEKKIVESKLYDLICSQIWSLLPGFCNEPTDLKECFKDVARLLGQFLKDDPTVRMTVLSSLRLLITKNLENEENREELSRYAKNYIPILLNLYTTDPKDKAEEEVHIAVYDTIKTYLQITDKELCTVFFTKGIEKLSAAEPGTFMQHSLLDVCKAILPFVEMPQIEELYKFCKPLLQHENKTTQKKSYSILNEICSSYSEACKTFIGTHFDDLCSLLCETTKGLTPSTKALRLNCLRHIVNNLSDNDMITRIVPEAVLCTKENSVKARAAAFNLLIAIGNAKKRLMPNDAKGAICEYIKILLAGLAGRTTHLISATILSIGRVLYEFKNDLDSNLIDMLIENMCLLMTSHSREVIVSAMSFLKILFSTVDTMDLLQHVEHMVKGITSVSEDNQRQLRFKSRELLIRLVRKFGYEMISKFVPTSCQKQLTNIRKAEARKKRMKEMDVEESDTEMPESKKKTNDFEAILADSDEELLSENEEESRPKKKSKKMKRNDPMLEEHGENDIVDFMDPAVNKRLLTSKPKKMSAAKKTESHFPVSQDGKFIIEDGDDSKSKKESISKILDKVPELQDDDVPNKKKKRKNEDSDDDDDGIQMPGVNKGIHRTNTKRLKKAPGEEFKAKKAHGDQKRGNVEPYAYVPFNRQALNKRKQVKLKGQYKNIVKAAKKGAKSGVKKKMHHARNAHKKHKK